MNKILKHKKLIAFFFLSQFICVQILANTTATLKSGTYVSIRILEELSTKKGAKNTQTSVQAIVDNDIWDKKGNLFIERGTPVVVDVESTKPKGMGKEGIITLKPKYTTAIDGQKIQLQGSKTIAGENQRTEAIVFGCCFGLCILPIIGFAFFACPGEDAYVPTDFILTNIVVDGNYSVEVNNVE